MALDKITQIQRDGIDSPLNLIGDISANNGNFSGILTAAAFSGSIAGTASSSGYATTSFSLEGTPDIVVGSVTGTTASFSGNVSIAGTLTYEDVTNIDSVGLITARSGIIATGVVTATSFDGIVEVSTDTTPQLGGDLDVNGNDITGTGNVDLIGVVTATSFSGDGSSLTGINAGYWEQTSVGINTLSSVGIGTTNPQYNLEVAGDVSFTGNLYQNGSLFESGGANAFNPWYVDGQQTLTSVDEEPIEIIAGPGIAITTKAVASVGIGTTFSKALTIAYDNTGSAINGIGTAVPNTDNEFYYSGPLIIDSVTTVDVPDGASNIAYVRHTDIIVESSGELIIADGDELIPDVLDLASPAVTNQIVSGDPLSVEDNGSVVGTDITSINFNSGLDVSVSGTKATVSSTAVSQATAVALSIALG